MNCENCQNISDVGWLFGEKSKLLNYKKKFISSTLKKNWTLRCFNTQSSTWYQDQTTVCTYLMILDDI